MKEHVEAKVERMEVAESDTGHAIENNDQDYGDMKRLGKKQEFHRNFGFWSSLGFTSVYQATWEIVIIVVSAGVFSGGFAGLFWTFIGTSIFYTPIVASIAEMASMAPTSGGQYHWVSEFAPPRYQKILSYASGWMSTLAWIAAQTSGPFLSVTLIQVMIDVRKPAYEFTSWQYTLLMLALLVSIIFFNTWAAPILPWLETVSLFVHVAGFLVVIITLWVCAPKASAKDVFATFVNESGWNMGTAILLNQVNTLYCILGSDTAVHISEEIQDASLSGPKVVWYSYLLNLAMGIITLITMLFCWGPVEQAINADVPYLVLFQQTNSIGVSLLDLILIFILIYVGNITSLAATSRETFAFARDRGLPFSSFISKLSTTTALPYHAIYTTSLLSSLLLLINLGSTLAFNITVSLSLLALLSTYSLSIGCVLYRRLSPSLPPLPPARWSLDTTFPSPFPNLISSGTLINALAFAYSCFALVWCCLPGSYPVARAQDANWGPALWVGVVVLASVFYVVHGRRRYRPPVMWVEGRRGEFGVGVRVEGVQHT
ncbi:MAG: hypothetical protein Q9227_007667 [Pyrenula ochraceoflavens]